MTHCGVCHNGIHTSRNDWKNSNHPIVSGHEIIGRVVEMAPGVKPVHSGGINEEKKRIARSLKGGIK
ncbi:alcohol dehydrogenase catalytic domain-containing protein [Arenibacter sp. H213]|uniref:alcohol dehydrogenase catalytic domain-containing protein n=1 Tax=Arenibacter TaxID=178469 RepID=UPI00333EF3B7